MTSRHRILTGLAAAVAIGLGFLALAARDTEIADAALHVGPTATAEERALQTTVTETGTLQRVDTRTITYTRDLTPRAAVTATPAATSTTTTDQATVTPAVDGGSAPTTGATGAPTTATTPAAAAPAPTSTTIPAGATDAAADADAEPDPITLTDIADVGAPIVRGTVLYSADDEPVVAFVGDVPQWREITYGIDDGEDIRQLEENLVALGYGEDVTVDGAFTNATASAIADWETDIGRASPDVIVEIGDIVFLDSDAVTLSQELSIGDELEPGAAVLVIGTEQQVIAGDVAAEQAATWGAGTEVDLAWADGSHTTGTVVATGRDVTDDQVDLLVAIGGEDSARLTGSEVTLTAIDDARPAALAVPVSAIIEGPGGQPAVRVPNGDADDVRPVALGLVAGGWVEVTDGLDAGTEVRLPG